MFVPAAALPAPVLLTARSADADTVADAVWLLLLGFGSAFDPVMVAVLFNVPVKAGAMFATSVNCADAPLANSGKLQMIVPFSPTAGALQIAAGPLFCENVLTVVPAGMKSVNDALPSASGPLFIAVMVHVIVLPAVAVGGPVFMMARSVVKTVRKDELLLLSGAGSSVFVETVAVFVKVVLDAVPAGMCPVSVNVAIVAGARLAMEQVIVPPEPAAGTLHENAGPLFWLSETNVIVPGSVSLSATVSAASGPALFTVIEYATSVLGEALPGPVF